MGCDPTLINLNHQQSLKERKHHFKCADFSRLIQELIRATPVKRLNSIQSKSVSISQCLYPRRETVTKMNVICVTLSKMPKPKDFHCCFKPKQVGRKLRCTSQDLGLQREGKNLLKLQALPGVKCFLQKDSLESYSLEGSYMPVGRY